jgi:protein TonB
MKLKLIPILAILTLCFVGKQTFARTAQDSTAKVAATPANEVLPQFPGGQEKLNEFIKSKIHPVKGVSGQVTVYFVVEKSGKLNHVKVIKGLTPAANKEAVRVIKLSPKWKPGTLNGAARRVASSAPVVFS